MADPLPLDEESKFVKEHNLDHVPLGTTYQLFVSGSFASGFATLFALVACATDDWTTFSSTVTEEERTTSYFGNAGLYTCSRTFAFFTFIPEDEEGVATTVEIYRQTNDAYIRCGGDSDLECPFMLIAQLAIIVCILLGGVALYLMSKVLSRRWDGLVLTAKFAVYTSLAQVFFIFITLILFVTINIGKFDGNSFGHPCGNFVLESSAIELNQDDNARQSEVSGLSQTEAELGDSLNYAIVSIVFSVISAVLVWKGQVGYMLFEYQHRGINNRISNKNRGEAPNERLRQRQQV